MNTAIEHEFGADIAELSLASISGGKVWPGRDALFPGGYHQIIDVLAEGLTSARDMRSPESTTVDPALF